MSFVAANGLVLMSVWIFKATKTKEENNDNLLEAQFHIEPQTRLLRGNWKRFYTFTGSGYSNKQVHAQIMEEFSKIWTELNPATYCWLFGDQLAAHKSPDTVEKCLNSHVMCWLLPANTSHFLQPLDDKIFACFKQLLQRSSNNLTVGHTLSPDELAMALYHAGYEAECVVLSDKVII